jgi:hypothetical protein
LVDNNRETEFSNREITIRLLLTGPLLAKIIETDISTISCTIGVFLAIFTKSIGAERSSMSITACLGRAHDRFLAHQ